MQTQKSKVDMGKALDVGLVVKESSGTDSEKHDTSSRSKNDIHAKDADCKPINDKEPMADVHLTAEHNVLANEQHHAKQSEFNNKGRDDQDAKQYNTLGLAPQRKMTSDHFKSGLGLHHMTSNVVSCGLPAVSPYIADTTGTPLSTFIEQDAPNASTSSKIQETHSPIISEGVEE
nr:hypothetical protein [Tanacetum cinerariifolium]